MRWLREGIGLRLDSIGPLSTRAREAMARMRGPLVRLLPVLILLLVVAFLTDPGRSTGDEGPILGATHRLLQGRYADLRAMDATRFLWHGPGLPAFLAPLVALGAPVAVLRLTSPLLMFAAVLLFYRLLRLRLGPRGSLIGAYALGLYAPAYYVLGTVSKDPLALLLAVAALDGTSRYLSEGRLRHALVAGLSLGWLVMTRLEYGWVVMLALIGALIWWLVAVLRTGERDRAWAPRRWTLVCAVAMLACVPWLIYTYAITHRVLYWGNSGGLSLYWMSAPRPNPLGEWHAPHTVLANPALAPYRPFFHFLATLPPVRRDLELQHVALVEALSHPATYALNLLANLGRMLVGFPFPFTLPLVLIVGMVLINGTLLGGLLAAGRWLWRRRHWLPRETLPFLFFATVGFAVHVLPTAEPRMLVPLIPVAIWMIGQGLSQRMAARSHAIA